MTRRQRRRNEEINPIFTILEPPHKPPLPFIMAAATSHQPCDLRQTAAARVGQTVDCDSAPRPQSATKPTAEEQADGRAATRSGAPAASDIRPASKPAVTPVTGQANPWPFHPADADGSVSEFDPSRQAENQEAGGPVRTLEEPGAWPYHGPTAPFEELSATIPIWQKNRPPESAMNPPPVPKPPTVEEEPKYLVEELGSPAVGPAAATPQKDPMRAAVQHQLPTWPLEKSHSYLQSIAAPPYQPSPYLPTAVPLTPALSQQSGNIGQYPGQPGYPTAPSPVPPYYRLTPPPGQGPAPAGSTYYNQPSSNGPPSGPPPISPGPQMNAQPKSRPGPYRLAIEPVLSPPPPTRTATIPKSPPPPYRPPPVQQPNTALHPSAHPSYQSIPPPMPHPHTYPTGPPAMYPPPFQPPYAYAPVPPPQAMYYFPPNGIHPSQPPPPSPLFHSSSFYYSSPPPMPISAPGYAPGPYPPQPPESTSKFSRAKRWFDRTANDVLDLVSPPLDGRYREGPYG